jgi:hypothetical protein
MEEMPDPYFDGFGPYLYALPPELRELLLSFVCDLEDLQNLSSVNILLRGAAREGVRTLRLPKTFIWRELRPYRHLEVLEGNVQVAEESDLRDFLSRDWIAFNLLLHRHSQPFFYHLEQYLEPLARMPRLRSFTISVFLNTSHGRAAHPEETLDDTCFAPAISIANGLLQTALFEVHADVNIRAFLQLVDGRAGGPGIRDIAPTDLDMAYRRYISSMNGRSLAALAALPFNALRLRTANRCHIISALLASAKIRCLAFPDLTARVLGTVRWALEKNTTSSVEELRFTKAVVPRFLCPNAETVPIDAADWSLLEDLPGPYLSIKRIIGLPLESATDRLYSIFPNLRL